MKKLQSQTRWIFSQVRKQEGILPKSVCTDCWAKLADFHDFYNAVFDAESVFLKNAEEKEVPNTTEVNYDSSECKDDVKIESMDIDFVGVKSSTLEDSVIQKTAQNSYEADATRPTRPKRPIIMTANSTPSKINSAQLISEHMKMTCFYCNIKIKTLAELTEHHQDKHSNECHLRVICCRSVLKLTDLLDHVEYHRNPNKYK